MSIIVKFILVQSSLTQTLAHILLFGYAVSYYIAISHGHVDDFQLPTHGMNETKLLQNTCGRKLFAKISGWFEQCLVVFLFVPHVIQVHQTDFLKQKKNINNLTTSGNKKHKKKKKLPETNSQFAP